MKKIRAALFIFISVTVNCISAAPPTHDFKVKGFHLDLRCEVMTMPALKAFAKDVSEMGINTLLLEWEATYPFTKHAVISNRYSYSKEEVRSFVAYCQSIGLDVIPVQHCFGHVEHILRHERYAQIREDKKEISQVCPMQADKAKVIFKEIFDEVAELHPSKYFHIGCDETYLLGSCKKCAAKTEKEGKSKLFVDYVSEMCKLITAMDKKPIIWADMLLKNPRAASNLPENLIVMDWNYGWKVNQFGNVDSLLRQGIKFWGAPALRCHPDNMYLVQWEKHFKNLTDFIPRMRQSGYEGIINTSWSTSGTFGFLYDTNWEVVEMYPVRYVYPLSGFRILVSAYAEALKTEEPFDYQSFFLKYTRERFGFNTDESQLLMKILFTPQMEAKDIKKEKLKDEKNKFIALQREINTLKPKRNQKELEHFKLMLDMRVQHLTFREIEAGFQSASFHRNNVSAMKKELENLISYSKKLDKRFIQLNQDFLFESEMKHINKIRNEKMNILYSTINQIDNKSN